MKKHELRNKVNDRAPSVYPKSHIAVLKRIIDRVYVPDWRQSSIDGLYSKSESIAKMGFACNLSWATVKAALARLKADGILVEHDTNKGSYTISIASLLSLPSKFKSTDARHLQRKILQAVAKRILRNGTARRSGSPHPPLKQETSQEGELAMVPTCQCVGPFCSLAA